VHAALEVDGHVERRAGLSDRRHACQRRVDRGVGLDVAELVRGVHLDRVEARLLARTRGLNRVLRAVPTDPRVGADRLARTPAEQLPDRYTGRTALDVPQRLRDTRQRAGENRAAAVEAAAPNHLEVILDPKRIGSDEVVRELVHGRRHGRRPALEHGLAPAGRPLVRAQLEKQPAGTHGEGLGR
jgi:hypothetical protein